MRSLNGIFFDAVGGVVRAQLTVFAQWDDGMLTMLLTAQVPFVTYYGKVGLELSKLVFHGQKMSPP